jgi:hypothetical protein
MSSSMILGNPGSAAPNALLGCSVCGTGKDQSVTLCGYENAVTGAYLEEREFYGESFDNAGDLLAFCAIHAPAPMQAARDPNVSLH